MNYKLGLLIAAIMLVLPSLAYATNPCGLEPAGVTSCIPINIVNTQSVATTTGFQIALGNLPFNALIGNVLVYNTISGAVVPSWVENSVLIWANLGTNVIAPNAGVNAIYAFGVAGSSTNYFSSSSGGLGEAPQLSATYAQYDNGNVVFNGQYENFSGSTIPGSCSQSGSTITFNNGVHVTGVATLTCFQTFNSIGNVIDIGNAELWSDISTKIAYFGYLTSLNYYLAFGGNCGPATICLWNGAATNTFVNADVANVVWSLATVAGNNAIASYNYKTESAGISASTGPTQVQFQTNSGAANIIASWSRVRIMPPKDIMPSVTYQPLVSGAIVTCTDNGNTVIQGGIYYTVNAMATVSCSITPSGLTANVFWNGGNKATNCNPCVYTGAWNGISNPIVANTLGNTITPGGTTSFTISFQTFQTASSTVNSGGQYETGVQLFSYSINISKVMTSGNVLFQVNDINYGWSNATTNPTSAQTFSFTYPTPLVQANYMLYGFNALVYTDNSVTQDGVANIVYQNILWNYFPVVNVISSQYSTNIVEGQNVTFNMRLYDVKGYAAASANAASVQIGSSSNTITDQIVAPYLYNAFAYSVIPSTYGLGTPTIGNPIFTNGNQILQLAFNGKDVWRNTTFSNLGIYQESVVQCGAGSGNFVGVNWLFYNTTPSVIVAQTNVFIQGFFVPALNTYTGATVAGTSAGFPVTPGSNTFVAASNTYQTCIYPSWGKFKVSGTYLYNDTNSITASYYFINQFISNTQTQVILYLSTLSTATLYNLAVLNVSSQTYVPALVQVALYNPNTNKTVVINELKTTGSGSVPTYLNIGSLYKFFAYSTSNVFLGSAGYVTAVSCSPSACTEIIPVGSSSTGYISPQLPNINYNCNNVVTAANTMTTSCTYTSVNGTSYNAQLLVQNNYNGTQTCLQSASGASSTLNCVTTNTGLYTYSYFFQVQFQGIWITEKQGQFGTSTLLFGIDGAFIAMLILIILALLFIGINVNVSLILVGIGIEGAGLIGLVNIPLLAGGGVIMFLGVILFIINRNQGTG